MLTKLVCVAMVMLCHGCAISVVENNPAEQHNALAGFWLGQNIANWSGLITEMDKVGDEKTLPFYTDDDWGRADLPNMWGDLVPHLCSKLKLC